MHIQPPQLATMGVLHTGQSFAVSIQSETQAKFQPQGSFQNAVGGKPGPPLPFGSYETGRSGDPRFHCEPTAAFKDRIALFLIPQHTDPSLPFSTASTRKMSL